MAVSPLTWMRAVRDATDMTAVRFAVLAALALRMKSSGAGFASMPQLHADVDVSISTVQRHLKWARANGWLRQTRRGHRVSGETVLASEWELTQPVTGDLLASDPTGQTGQPNRSDGTTQPVTGDHPRVLQSLDPHPSARDDAAAPVGAGAALRARHRERVARKNGNAVIPLKECPGCERMFRPPSPRWEDGVYCRDCLNKTTRRAAATDEQETP